MIGILCFVLAIALDSQVEALTKAEKNVGLSITRKLDSLMAPKMAAGRYGATGDYPNEVDSSSLDMMLVLDSSGSIGLEEFGEAKDATALIVDYVDSKAQIGRSGSRVGLVQFSSESKTRVVFSFGDHNSVWSVNRAIHNLRYTKGTTATAKALKLAGREFNRHGNDWNAKVAWLLTDGKSNRGKNPVTEARKLRNMGVTVCAVAIGRKVNMREIRGIADSGCVYEVSSFGSFKQAIAYASNASTNKNTPSRPRPKINPGFFDNLQL